MLTLRELKTHNPFEVALTGTMHTSHLAQAACLYFEWVYGEKNGEEWAMFVKGFQTSGGLTVVTAWGNFHAEVNQLRLYLPPAYTHTYNDLADPEAFAEVREMMHTERKPVTVEEYRLVAGQTYYAQVDAESYWLPPEGEGKPPSRHLNHVLAISDLPFLEGKPQRLLTPVYQGWSY